MSVEHLITEHLDIWTSAIKTKSAAGRGSSKKLELVGIKKLRELILELAVRGNLVPQEPNDEPASELLKRIEAEKARLVIEGKIKKYKPSPKIKEEEKPFSMPDGWDCARLGEVTEIVRGITFPSSEKSKTPQEGRVACLRTANVQEQIFWDDMLYIRDQFVKRDDQYVLKNDIVMSMANSRELVGKVAIIDETPQLKTTFGGFLGVIRPLHLLAPFIMCILNAPTNRELLIGSASQTTNIANISLAKLKPMVFSIPPLAEQHRIVAKVDELMALCDQLEAQTENSIQAHQLLVETLLATLTNAKDADELSKSWQRISQHFDVLFTTQDSIDQLKHTILQLAVMGKLVKQNPNDEPASKLLERIAAEKDRLVKAGKIKKQKPLAPIKDEEKQFDLPSGWEWVRFSSISNEVATGPFGSMIHKSDYIEGGVPLINPSHMLDSRIVEDKNITVTNSKASELSSYLLSEGDVVMARRGEMGRCALVTKREDGWLCGTGSFILKFSGVLSREYIVLLFSTQWVRRYLAGESIGTTMTNLNHGILNKLPLLLPPISEQKRIVLKVQKLLVLCKDLEDSLLKAQSKQLTFANIIGRSQN